MAGSSPFIFTSSAAKRILKEGNLLGCLLFFCACRAAFAQKPQFCARLWNKFMRSAKAKVLSPTPYCICARRFAFAPYLGVFSVQDTLKSLEVATYSSTYTKRLLLLHIY